MTPNWWEDRLVWAGIAFMLIVCGGILMIASWGQKQVDRCEEKGGVYSRGICIPAEDLIRLD